MDSRFVRGWLQDDTAAVLSVFSPDAVLLPPGSKPVLGREAIQAYWWPHDGSRTRITGFERTITEIEGAPTLAILRGEAHLSWIYSVGGKDTAQSSHSFDLLVVAPDSSGAWHVVRQMWNTAPD